MAPRWVALVGPTLPHPDGHVILTPPDDDSGAAPAASSVDAHRGGGYDGDGEAAAGPTPSPTPRAQPSRRFRFFVVENGATLTLDALSLMAVTSEWLRHPILLM